MTTDKDRRHDGRYDQAEWRQEQGGLASVRLDLAAPRFLALGEVYEVSAYLEQAPDGLRLRVEARVRAG